MLPGLSIPAHHLACSSTMQREPPSDPQSPRWSETSDVMPMFATLVWKVELEARLREAIGAQALAAIARLRRGLPPLPPRQGGPSIQSLHQLEGFRELLSF